MRNILLLLGLTGVASLAAAATEIHPIHSWGEYRQHLLDDGKPEAEAEADAEIDSMLAKLNDMDRSAGDDRIGAQAPPFRFEAWLNSPPLKIEALRGRVLLVRWWTDTCPFCASSAPALRELHASYADRGLTVIGVFHPKAGRDDPLDLARVQRAVAARQFLFPIAIDWHWRQGTLKDWWLTGPERPATSVTFIVDAQGIIRFIHPGMEYHERPESGRHAVCADDLGRIRAVIEQLLE